MAEVGSLQIGGSVDTQAIENGLTRVEGGLKNVAAAGDSVNSDFVRINENAKELGNNLKVIAVAGATAVIALAKGSPAVAGAMAKINVSMGKLSRTLGEILKPAFDEAANSLGGFVNFIKDNQGVISSFVDNYIKYLNEELGTLTGLWSNLTSFRIPVLDITIGEGLQKIIDLSRQKLTDIIPLPNITKLFGEDNTFETRLSEVGRVVGPTGTGSAFGNIFGLIGRGVDLLLSKQDRKSNSLELEYAT